MARVKNTAVLPLQHKEKRMVGHMAKTPALPLLWEKQQQKQ